MKKWTWEGSKNFKTWWFHFHSRGRRLRYIVYWWFIPNRKWLISWGKIFLKVWLLQVNWKTLKDNAPRGLILKIVPHLWSYEASLGKHSGAFAFKAFRALAAALEDDQVAKLPSCQVGGWPACGRACHFSPFPPFFCPCPLLQLAGAFRGAKTACIWNLGLFKQNVADSLKSVIRLIDI